jgi:hypothetical protein
MLELEALNKEGGMGGNMRLSQRRPPTLAYGSAVVKLRGFDESDWMESH